MWLEVARRYADLVQGVEVERFRVVGESYELRATVSLRDGSKVCVKEYLFLDGSRKDAYHGQDQAGHLISRWDNASHWRGLSSYPHHRHVGASDVVEASEVRTLDQVFADIRRHGSCQ